MAEQVEGQKLAAQVVSQPKSSQPEAIRSSSSHNPPVPTKEDGLRSARGKESPLTLLTLPGGWPLVSGAS